MRFCAKITAVEKQSGEFTQHQGELTVLTASWNACSRPFPRTIPTFKAVEKRRGAGGES